MLESLGGGIQRHRWLTLGVSGAFLVVAVVLLSQGHGLTSAEIHGLEAGEAQRLADEITGQPRETTVVVIFESRGTPVTGPELDRDIARALAPLRSDPRVSAVVAPADAPVVLGVRMRNPGAGAAFAIVGLEGGLREAIRSYPGVRAKLRSDRLSIRCTGQVPFIVGLGHTLDRDLVRAELISIPLALLVLLLVFRTAVAAALPVGVGSLSVAGGLAVVFLASRHLELAQVVVNVCTLIGLGVAIDYALFLISRYREELAAGRGPREALSRALATAGQVILFSGGVLITGLGGLLFFEGSYLRAMGLGGVTVVGLSIFFALTFMPALLAVLGPRIHAGRLPLPRLDPAVGVLRSAAAWTGRHPVVAGVTTLGVLVVLALPVLRLRVAAADVRVLSTAVEARSAYERLRALFPDQAASRVVVVARFPTTPALTAERIGALHDLSRRVAALPGVHRVESIVDAPVPISRSEYPRLLLHPPAALAGLVETGKRYTVGRRTVVLQVVTEGATDDLRARQAVRAIRSDRRVADGTVVVGGETAQDLDATAYIVARAPRAAGFVVGVTLLVLIVLLGSVVLPLQAVATSFLSILVALGALVWVFQDGHLFVTAPRPLEPALPMLLFCTVFGLSMDYQVLMLARMREVWVETGDHGRAVTEGLARAAGLIASAAAIMVAVFGAFGLADVVVLQAMGFGLALAVGVDALLIRLVLVPALMRLVGRICWWAPPGLESLRRWLHLS